ncbi:UDP-3-O-(3-hydroxymyristoyl)glucosamine N-acyltransferase [Hydrogenobacter hydrogenophilus]|uniref:UDP-3-O-acylglucosamine N-acyltransferase n=1 Tax=Hydrogenobacter hydrogenophilus TaxID=35835 RepID=A0A285NRM7_9AQUI|nr:UDP-3-O-(3-hydroxymyristoyl)glucosamine N-acyltransferase [Hydrogenobacter hydrogenophilus]SNZ11593.1 UDP-3-O-[3-hydroxymyristoyl] glucosamine N-acyltransferase [Hydrogenobacter hydrogenophilus]
MRLSDVASILGGELQGDENFEINGISSVEDPKPRTLVFCWNKGDIQKVKGSKDIVLVVDTPVEHPNTLLVKDVKHAMAVFLKHMYPEKHPSGVSSTAYVGKNVHMGKDVYIAPFVYVGDGVFLGDGVKIYPFSYIGDHCVIGDETIIFSGVHIYPKCVIGRRVRIHSGTVIGADGFGYHISNEGITKLNHIGTVIIEDDVEVGANTTIDRALLDKTIVGRGTKIDNLVMIGHNCRIGENNIIVSQVGLSGSVKTGKNVILAGQVGVADHINIGDHVVVTAKSGVANDLEPNKTYGANLPAVEWNRWKRIYLYLLKLPELFKKLGQSPTGDQGKTT